MYNINYLIYLIYDFISIILFLFHLKSLDFKFNAFIDLKCINKNVYYYCFNDIYKNYNNYYKKKGLCKEEREKCIVSL